MPTQGVSAETEYAVVMTPSEVEARCEGALTWRTQPDTSFGRIRLAPIAWTELVTDAAEAVDFTTAGHRVDLWLCVTHPG